MQPCSIENVHFSCGYTYWLVVFTHVLRELDSGHMLLVNSICRRGLAEQSGAKGLLMEGLEKVEKELKKPLLRNNKGWPS